MDDPLAPSTTNLSTPSDQEDTQTQPISTGGFSPEVVSAPATNQEQNTPKESGYENIQQIERKAEEIEHKETKKPAQTGYSNQKPAQPSPKPISIEKKEPKGPKFKYFGYKPPQSLMANLSKLKSQAGRGSTNDSKTWLLFFLDRLAKKEDK